VGVVPTRMVAMLTARGGVPGVIRPVTAVAVAALEDETVTLKGVDGVDVALLTAKERAATSDADRARDDVDDVDFHTAV